MIPVRLSRNLLAIVLLGAAAGCGPKPIEFVRETHPQAAKYFIDSVDIYYSHDKTPKSAKVLDHVTQTCHNTTCETAAVMCLVKMQKEAAERGGNALVRIKAVSKSGAASSNAKGFWCARMSAMEEGGDLTNKIWEITWEGDIAVIGRELAGEYELTDEGEVVLSEEEAKQIALEAQKAEEAEVQAYVKDLEKQKKSKPKPEPEEPAASPTEPDLIISPAEMEQEDIKPETEEDIYK